MIMRLDGEKGGGGMLTWEKRRHYAQRLAALRKRVEVMEHRFSVREAVRICRQLAAEMQTDDALLQKDVYAETLDSIAELLSDRFSDGMSMKEQKKGRVLLDDILVELSARIAAEPRKKTLLFLPYKASMWDSFESVYRAAMEDAAQVEALIMPIPYCDRGQDGTAVRWNDEGGLFREHYPILDWRDVSLADLCADIIFIHNPYDGKNTLTSVSSDFYSDRLKSFCKAVVYIPYYVNVYPLKPIFMNMPGCYHADYIIEENAASRQRFLAHYDGPDKARIEDKVLALGSPKYDAVILHGRDAYVLPASWEEKMRGRKIVLYATTIETMNRVPDAVLQHMSEVFAYYRGRRDVCLWWRPHPLLKNTFAKMHPKALEMYEAMERVYVEEAWGIYDDTAEMHRAIACADAYDGEASSVMALFQATGKPTLVHRFANMEIHIEGGNLFVEHETMEREDFIERLCTAKSIPPKPIYDGAAGARIYRFCKRLCEGRHSSLPHSRDRGETASSPISSSRGGSASWTHE